MAAEERTSKKRPAKPFKGDEGKTFDANYQPSPQAKSEGWKKLRAQRLLTQEILKDILEGQNLLDYAKTMRKLAKEGNAKAIETINRAIEDDIAKVAFTDTEGNDVKPFQFILDERYKTDTGSNNSSIPA